MIPAAFAAQSLCAAIALPAATIITVGTGLGLAIGHLIDTHIDPPPPTTHASTYLSLAVLTAIAGIVFVAWDYFHQFQSRSRALKVSQPAASSTSSHRASEDVPKPGHILQAESIPQYADEVPLDFVSDRRRT
eukprot:Gregarina_sp_Poly_1__10772@NODE_825_length_6116_cov_136_856175_g597_i0_p9_GENE_NODE_825_length_6116_cov_136_856175_g597_i0NODE_825_length_6116_cov_136_856175_g597_i0_p9_ORF_typecomplete_len133_score10_84Abhydrolase_9_N/PF15420_6/0_0045Fumarate_red_D/PF02313_17/0_013PgaD/PF13994_6/0_068PAP_PilO/PF06864_12/0_059DUF2427/PF10348_9/0_13UPF0126/PF03458_13/0_22Tad/PF13400_6/8_7e02Tad/PF13400_6/1e03Tad/PF13400_6/0_6_NODE_825_length_6116_cov_136_856175_g597_i010941492